MSILTTLLDLLMSFLNALFGAKPKVAPAPQPTQVAAPPPEPEPEPEPEAPEPIDWLGWEGLDHVTFWTRMFAMEELTTDAERDAQAREWGLPGLEGLERVQELFQEHFGDDPDFMQAAATARQSQMNGWMADAVDHGASPLLEPIDGVSVETWATIAATLATMGDDPEGYHRLLAEHDLDAAAYEAAQQGWIERMQSVDDPMAAGAIATIYGEAFTATRTGSASNGAAEGAEAPCSFERYCEIMGAQSAWASDGRDVNASLKEVFGITAVDWSDYGAYWNARMMSDIQLATRMGDLLDHYTEQHRSTDDADADLVL